MHPRMAPRLPLESEAGTQSQVSLRSCWLGTHDGHGGSGSVCTWWLKEAPMKIPFPPSSPDPRADGMLVGGDLPAEGFPQHWNAVSPSSCCPRGFSHPRHWVGASHQLQLCPHCANSFLPSVILISSSSLARARLLAGSWEEGWDQGWRFVGHGPALPMAT